MQTEPAPELLDERREQARNRWGGRRAGAGAKPRKQILRDIDRAAALLDVAESPYLQLALAGRSPIELIRICAMHLMEAQDFKAAGRLFNQVIRHQLAMAGMPEPPPAPEPDYELAAEDPEPAPPQNPSPQPEDSAILGAWKSTPTPTTHPIRISSPSSANSPAPAGAEERAPIRSTPPSAPNSAGCGPPPSVSASRSSSDNIPRSN